MDQHTINEFIFQITEQIRIIEASSSPTSVINEMPDVTEQNNQLIIYISNFTNYIADFANVERFNKLLDHINNYVFIPLFNRLNYLQTIRETLGDDRCNEIKNELKEYNNKMLKHITRPSETTTTFNSNSIDEIIFDIPRINRDELKRILKSHILELRTIYKALLTLEEVYKDINMRINGEKFTSNTRRFINSEIRLINREYYLLLIQTIKQRRYINHMK